MCLIYLSLNHHPAYPLIVAANRDEFYQRRTAPAGYWSDHPDIVGGRDLEAMGTWMAMSKRGKIAMVTNYRDPKNINPAAPSRGKLVSDYLIMPVAPQTFLQALAPHGQQYNGFNLVLGHPDELFYYSNYGDGVLRIKDGIHALSNHLLDTPWPKVSRVKEKFSGLTGSLKIEPGMLLDALYDEKRAPAGQLPDTGVGPVLEEALSSMFIKNGNYGTRCSTVVLVNNHGEVTYTERQYDTATFLHHTASFRFTI